MVVSWIDELNVANVNTCREAVCGGGERDISPLEFPWDIFPLANTA